MKEKIAQLIKFISHWKTVLLEQAKRYSTEWLSQVTQTQNQYYQLAHDWLGTRVPVITQRYDAGPAWLKKGLFYLPWVLLLVMTLNYFNVFDRSPAIKSVQDPNVVVVNLDLRKMISDGKVQVAPFVEELRASGRIDFNELFLSRIGANVTGRVSEILAVPGQMVKQGDVLAKITSTELTQSQLAYLKAKSASQLADQAANRAKILYKEDVIALAELQKREAEANKAAESKTEIGWGHQIRSYVLQPYQLVKDLRTGFTSGTPGDVLDGELDDFMQASLAQKIYGGGPESVEDVE